MDDKQLLAQFAAAALTGFMMDNKNMVIAEKQCHDIGMTPLQAVSRVCCDISEAMLAEFKQRTEQKGNGND